MVVQDPKDRAAYARLAALDRWSREPDRTAATAKARAAFDARFYDATDPSLPDAQRRKMAEAGRRAYFQRIALKSRQSRAARKAKTVTGGAA